MWKTKCRIVWITLIAFFLMLPAFSFAQISHEDSMVYFDDLQLFRVLGLDARGKTIPDFTLKNQNRILFTQDSLSLKITVINLWFEACAPCVAEFQALEKFYNKNKSRKNFQFISITYEQDSVIKRIREKYQLTYPMFRLSIDSCRKIIQNLGYPTTFIVNGQLEIVFSKTGGPNDPKTADIHLNHFIQAELEKYLVE